MRRRRALAAVLVPVSVVLAVGTDVPTASAARTVINVPGDVPTIQGAIDVAQDGTVVRVAPGRYHERIRFRGRRIVVRSAAGPSQTIIDGTGVDSVAPVVTFDSGETRATVLRGFTITGGRDVNAWCGTASAGGVNVCGASPTILGNVIEGNLGRYSGGIAVCQGGPLIKDNVIRENGIAGVGTIRGGGISVTCGFDTEIVGNVITANEAHDGGAIWSGTSRLLVRNNVISHNRTYHEGSAVFAEQFGTPVLVQNLVVGNETDVGGAVIHLHLTESHYEPFYLVNNTVVSSDGAAFWAAEWQSLGSDEVRGNIFVAQGPGATAFKCSGEGSRPADVFRNNNVYGFDGALTWDGCAPQEGSNGNISRPPRFVAPASGDFRLRPTSPARDAGDPTARLLPARDLAGRDRTVGPVDMGAYEYQG